MWAVRDDVTIPKYVRTTLKQLLDNTKLFRGSNRWDKTINILLACVLHHICNEKNCVILDSCLSVVDESPRPRQNSF